MLPPAAIIVPTRGRPHYLDRALASIAPQAAALGAQVIVVDDGPEISTRTVAEAHGVGGHHLGVQQRAPRQVTVEHPAMPVGPVHHRGDAEAVGQVGHSR